MFDADQYNKNPRLYDFTPADKLRSQSYEPSRQGSKISKGALHSLSSEHNRNYQPYTETYVAVPAPTYGHRPKSASRMLNTAQIDNGVVIGRKKIDSRGRNTMNLTNTQVKKRAGMSAASLAMLLNPPSAEKPNASRKRSIRKFTAKSFPDLAISLRDIDDHGTGKASNDIVPTDRTSMHRSRKKLLDPIFDEDNHPPPTDWDSSILKPSPRRRQIASLREPNQGSYNDKIYSVSRLAGGKVQHMYCEERQRLDMAELEDPVQPLTRYLRERGLDQEERGRHMASLQLSSSPLAMSTMAVSQSLSYSSQSLAQSRSLPSLSPAGAQGPGLPVVANHHQYSSLGGARGGGPVGGSTATPHGPLPWPKSPRTRDANRVIREVMAEHRRREAALADKVKRFEEMKEAQKLKEQARALLDAKLRKG